MRTFYTLIAVLLICIFVSPSEVFCASKARTVHLFDIENPERAIYLCQCTLNTMSCYVSCVENNDRRCISVAVCELEEARLAISSIKESLNREPFNRVIAECMDRRCDTRSDRKYIPSVRYAIDKMRP